jgi:RNA methyltransferase, TrmH family
MDEIISSLTNAKVKYVGRLQTDRRFREQEHHFVVEGSRWLAELIAHDVTPHTIYCTAAWAGVAENGRLLAQVAVSPLLVADPVMRRMSDTQTPPGVLAVAPMPSLPWPSQPEILLILDQVGNPGNLGTMLRTAAAAGVNGVLLAPGCVDAFNPKAVRGGMGAHLRLPIRAAGWPEIKTVCAELAVWTAAADGQIGYTDVNWRQPSALIIGSEASGPGPEAAELSQRRAYIPMSAATESLNAAVAAAVILFEAARQRGGGVIGNGH